jgi:hypothetical protein
MPPVPMTPTISFLLALAPRTLRLPVDRVSAPNPADFRNTLRSTFFIVRRHLLGDWGNYPASEMLVDEGKRFCIRRIDLLRIAASQAVLAIGDANE